MNVLLLHGLHGQPAPDRIESLQQLGFDKVIAPHIEYTQEGVNGTLEILRDLIREHQIDITIGNSIGGFFAYWLAEEAGLNCLLFNPAMILAFHEEYYHRWIKDCKVCMVVTGLKDLTVSTDSVLDYFNNKARPELKPFIIIEPDMEHRVLIDEFEKAAQKFLLHIGQ